MAGIRDRAARYSRLRVSSTTLVVAALLLASCAQRTPLSVPSSPQPTLAIATWNMHAGRGDLAQLRYDLASGFLTDGVPDDYVLLLQEAIPPLDADGLSFFFAPIRGKSGNAILSTRPLLDPHVITLERERQPRSALAATIRLDKGSLFVVNVHMENRLVWWQMLFSDTARGRQAEALLREVPQRGDGILGGDLNTWLGPNEPAWRMMLRRFPDTPRDTAQPTFRDRLVLDHLFFDLPDGWRVSRRVINNAYGSDHHPVVAVVHDR